MRARFPIWPVLAALALSACGSGGSPSSGSTPSSSSSVSAAGSQPLIVVAEQAAGGFDSGATTVHLMRRDGTEADRLTIKQHSMVSRAAGSRIFVTGNDGSLKAVHRDGSVESLGSVGTSQPDGFIVSPDGKRWMWQTNDGNTSRVYLAGDGLTSRAIAESHENARAITTYSWTAAGAFLVDTPVGIGGYILFDTALGPIQKVDLNSFTAKPVAHTDTCQFSDMASDGTLACFPRSADRNSRSLSLISPDGKATTVQLAMPRFTQYGDAYFSRDGRQLTVAGATSVGSENQPEQFGMDIMTTADASIKRLAVDGVRPSESMQAQTWLEDGSLVVWRPDGAAGGSSGVFVISPTGQSKQITTGRTMPIGILVS